MLDRGTVGTSLPSRDEGAALQLGVAHLPQDLARAGGVIAAVVHDGGQEPCIADPAKVGHLLIQQGDGDPHPHAREQP